MPKWKIILIGLVLIGVVYQLWFTLDSAWTPLQQVYKSIGKSGAWRGVNFSAGQDFANYVEFLGGTIPLNAQVVLPPEGSGPPAMSRTPYMQFFLAPRQVVNCAEAVQTCATNFNAAGAYILVTREDSFPGDELISAAQLTGQLRMFDKNLGVILPAGGQVAGVEPAGSDSFIQIVLKLLLPLAWVLVLSSAGWMIVQRAASELDLISQLALGFGIGVGGFSLLLYIPLLAGLSLSRGLIVVSSIVWLVIGILFALAFRRKAPARPVIGLGQAIYLAAFLAVAGLSAILAIGRGYFWSDEVVLWGVKGYGIAALGLSSGVSDWGTRTVGYPLQLPLLIGSFRSLFGDGLPESKILFPLYYLGLSGLIFSFLRERTGLHLAAGLTLIFAAAPLVFYQGSLAYANLPLTFYLVGAAVLAASTVSARAADQRVSSTDTNLVLVLSGICFALAAWTRPEGIFLAGFGLTLTALILAWHSGWRRFWGAVLALIGPILLIILLWYTTKGLVYHQSGWSNEFIRSGLSRFGTGLVNWDGVGYVLRSLFLGLFDLSVWGLLGFAVLLAVVVVPFILRKAASRNIPGIYLVISGTGYLLLIVGLYLILANTPESNISWWVDTGLNRMLLPGITILFLGATSLL